MVLRALLAKHPELLAEANAIAVVAMTTVSAEQIAAAIDDALLALDIDDLGARAGEKSSGYVEPTEAAWEILQEHVDPFLSDMSRLIELGSRDAAVATCEGIILGLYRVRDAKPDGVLGWAEDFPAEAAGRAAETLARTNVAKHRRRWTLRDELVASVPDWASMLERAGVIERSRPKHRKPSPTAPAMTPRQGQLLAFIDAYARVHGRPPAEHEICSRFGLTPPTVHQAILTMEKRGLIARTPAQARSIRILVARGALPRLVEER